MGCEELLIVITVNNQVFNSIEKAAKHYGQPFYSVQGRLYRGYTIEQALNWDQDKSEHRGRSYTYQGKTYISISQIARQFSLHVSTISRSLQETGDIDETMRYLCGKRHTVDRGYRYTYKNKTYYSMASLSKDLGIPRSSIQRTLDRTGDLNKTLNYHMALKLWKAGKRRVRPRMPA